MNRFNLNNKGQSVVELSMLLPLLVIILFGVIEYSNMFMVSLRASNLSRVVTNSSFRDCASLSGNALTNCLNTQLARTLEEGNLILPDFESKATIIASAFSKEDEALNVTLLDQRSAGEAEYESRFNASTINSSIVDEFGRVVVGEIFYQYVPVTPLSVLMTAFNIRSEVYETTIY